jgi:hypothetical protein
MHSCDYVILCPLSVQVMYRRIVLAGDRLNLSWHEGGGWSRVISGEIDFLKVWGSLGSFWSI